MNTSVAIKEAGAGALAVSEEEAIRVLGASMYPGAKIESIKMVLGYCKAARLDPMRKPVHIVPMSVKVPKKSGSGFDYEWRDVIMPGIDLYRTKATETGQYLGMSEPEFGPTLTVKLGSATVKVPEWCRVTVIRNVKGHRAEFTAREFWMENYATAGRDSMAPNAMWARRPFAQLAKCAEAQALRRAFPDTIGGEATAEEMEGKVIDASALSDGPQASGGGAAKVKAKSGVAQLDGFAGGGEAEISDKTKKAPTGSKGDAEISDKKATEASGSTGKAKVEQQVEDAEVVHDLPEMPQDAAEAAMFDNRPGKAWAWLTEAVLGLQQPEQRQALFDLHRPVVDAIRLVQGHGKDGADAVREFCEKAGVKDGDGTEAGE
jgi:phage recombination protein Bet